MRTRELCDASLCWDRHHDGESDSTQIRWWPGSNGLRVLFAVAAVAFAALVVLPRGSVAAGVTSFAAAQGQIGSPATVITDPTAADGQAVPFQRAHP